MQLNNIVCAVVDVRLQPGSLSMHSALDRKKKYEPKIPAAPTASKRCQPAHGASRGRTHRQVLETRDEHKCKHLLLQVS